MSDFQWKWVEPRGMTPYETLIHNTISDLLQHEAIAKLCTHAYPEATIKSIVRAATQIADEVYPSDSEEEDLDDKDS